MTTLTQIDQLVVEFAKRAHTKTASAPAERAPAHTGDDLVSRGQRLASMLDKIASATPEQVIEQLMGKSAMGGTKHDLATDEAAPVKNQKATYDQVAANSHTAQSGSDTEPATNSHEEGAKTVEAADERMHDDAAVMEESSYEESDEEKSKLSSYKSSGEAGNNVAKEAAALPPEFLEQQEKMKAKAKAKSDDEEDKEEEEEEKAAAKLAQQPGFVALAHLHQAKAGGEELTDELISKIASAVGLEVADVSLLADGILEFQKVSTHDAGAGETGTDTNEDENPAPATDPGTPFIDSSEGATNFTNREAKQVSSGATLQRLFPGEDVIQIPTDV